jgi:hypothetical protein
MVRVAGGSHNACLSRVYYIVCLWPHGSGADAQWRSTSDTVAPTQGHEDPHEDLRAAPGDDDRAHVEGGAPYLWDSGRPTYAADSDDTASTYPLGHLLNAHA